MQTGPFPGKRKITRGLRYNHSALGPHWQLKRNRVYYMFAHKTTFSAPGPSCGTRDASHGSAERSEPL